MTTHNTGYNAYAPKFAQCVAELLMFILRTYIKKVFILFCIAF
jgi:hypothetical protein